MEIEFDSDKDLVNRRKHGISLAAAADMDFETALVIADERFEYGEARFHASGRIGGRLHALAFTFCAARRCGRSPCARRTIGKGAAMNDDENPEWTAADFARAKPFKDVFPLPYETLKKRGRPPVATPKTHIGFRLAADVVDGIRATGRGYNARVEKVLRDALAKGRL